MIYVAGLIYCRLKPFYRILNYKRSRNYGDSALIARLRDGVKCTVAVIDKKAAALA